MEVDALCILSLLVACFIRRHGGGGGAEAPTAGEEVTTEAPESGNTEVERESLVSPGEQTEMWAA